MSDVRAEVARSTGQVHDGPLVSGARKVEETARTVKEKVAGGFENAKTTLQTKPLGEMWNDAESFVRSHPGRTMLISLGVGALVGFLLARRRH
jgi:ElaB/YqjD/DUF883 family membrane-anchored ribosome-binding protein